MSDVHSKEIHSKNMAAIKIPVEEFIEGMR
jgi:hypothetical protein